MWCGGWRVCLRVLVKILGFRVLVVVGLLAGVSGLPVAVSWVLAGFPGTLTYDFNFSKAIFRSRANSEKLSHMKQGIETSKNLGVLSSVGYLAREPRNRKSFS